MEDEEVVGNSKLMVGEFARDGLSENWNGLDCVNIFGR